MSQKAERGTKRTCQNDDCAVRFYDLNRDPITCPACGSAYVVVAPSAAAAAASAAASEAVRKQAVARAAPVASDADAPELADDGVEVEADDDVEIDEDETFLEEDEDDGSDVSGIIGGVSDEDDES